MSVLTAARRRRPPQRRTYLAAAARRAQILDVAKSMFARRGYHDANVADICKAARIGRGTLYQYFENKRSVLLALMEDLAARLARLLEARPRVAAMPEVSRAPAELIAAFCERRLRELLDAVFVDEPTLRLLLREARGMDGAVDEVIATIDKLVLAAMEDDLRAAQRFGLLRAVDLRLTAQYLLGGVEKMVLTALTGDAPVDLDAIVHVAIQLELFGILNPPGGRR
jgi:AcrR family transcriptional regulator